MAEGDRPSGLELSSGKVTRSVVTAAAICTLWVGISHQKQKLASGSGFSMMVKVLHGLVYLLSKAHHQQKQLQTARCIQTKNVHTLSLSSTLKIARKTSYYILPASVSSSALYRKNTARQTWDYFPPSDSASPMRAYVCMYRKRRHLKFILV